MTRTENGHEKIPTELEKVLAVVATWKARAKALGIAAADVHEMEHLFITERKLE